MRYPKLIEAGQLMEADQGMSTTTWNDERVISALRARSDMDFVEDFLATLSEDDFNTVCVGEHDDMHAIANRDSSGRVHEVLDELFMCVGC